MTAAQLAARLPGVEIVRRRSQSLAVLDAIMSADREYRYFSFDADYASEYFEHQPPGEAVTAVIEQRPLTEALVRALNSERSLHDLAGDLDRIGYPSG